MLSTTQPRSQCRMCNLGQVEFDVKRMFVYNLGAEVSLADSVGQ